jgi:hypothetical protein
MKKRIQKHLSNKQLSDYNQLDNILMEYLNGNLEKRFQENGYTDIEIYPDMTKYIEYMQVKARLGENVVHIEFHNNFALHWVYLPYSKIDVVDSSMRKQPYTSDFDLDYMFKLIKERIL